MSVEKKKRSRVKKSPVEHLREFFNLGKIQKMFRVGPELVTAVQPVFEAQTPLNIAKSVMMVGRLVVDNLEIWPDEYFEEAWESPFPTDFNGMLLNVFAGKPFKTLKTSDEGSLIYIIDVTPEIKAGYVMSTRTKIVSKVYFESDKLEKAREVITAELWGLMRDDNLVLRHVKRPRAAEEDYSSIALEKDDAFQPMPSQRATEYSAYLKKCIDAGVSRSVLLYGPPGTGKSTMARTIVDSLGLKSFRIRVEDIGHLETSTIFEAIDIFRPDSIILDDFDRSVEQSALLETLEYFQRHVKLVIATVNDKNKLDEAILRPGRFDELVQIKKMDDDVVKAVLGKVHRNAFEVVHDWPIAFIQEYVKRLRFMNPSEAEQSVRELATRVKRLSRYDDDEEETVSSLDSKKSTEDLKRVTEVKHSILGIRKRSNKTLVKHLNEYLDAHKKKIPMRTTRRRKKIRR